MGMRVRFICGVVLCVLLLSAGMAGAAKEGTGERRVSADFREAKLQDALKVVFRDTPYSYLLMPGVADPPRSVTAALKDVEFTKALGLVCDAAGLTYVRKGDAFIVTAKEAVVTVGGGQVPIVGAMRAEDLKTFLDLRPEVREKIVTQFGDIGFGPPAPAAGARPAPALTEPPASSRHLVDLVVKDMPLREAIAQFSKASGAEVVVHDAVSRDIRVTVKAYMVDAWWLLKAITDQAGLRIQEEPVTWAKDEGVRPTAVPQGGVGINPRHGNPLVATWKYSIVPKIELQVTDPVTSQPAIQVVPLPGYRPVGPDPKNFLPLGEPPAAPVVEEVE